MTHGRYQVVDSPALRSLIAESRRRRTPALFLCHIGDGIMNLWRRKQDGGRSAATGSEDDSGREIAVAGQRVPVRLRRSKRARRMLLKLHIESGGVELVLPPKATSAQAFRFLDQHTGWLAERLEALPPRIIFADGAVIPVLGIDHRIRWQPVRGGAVRRVGREIHVSGELSHLNRRVTDWLKSEAKREISDRSRTIAAQLGKMPARVSLRDTRSRWGSCSARGTLSFSWRLILAPEAVLDYVVAHEVSHLIEMNHGPRFWGLVDALVDDADAARAWLRRFGLTLHRYG